jgi:transcription initiation factor TFIID subunit 3
MSDRLLHHALLRPAIIQILRAQGFAGAKPSVVDTLTDIAAKYIMLLATRALSHAHTSHDVPELDVTDVRMAMVDCGILQPSTTASQEVWRELLRKPLDELPDREILQRAITSSRDEEDTEDVAAFVKWFGSNAYREIVRVAGLSHEEDLNVLGELEKKKPQNYLALLKKKQSKAGGEGSRFTGTVLGRDAEMKPVKIDGSTGMPESIEEWQERVKQRSKKLAGTRHGNDEIVKSVEMEDVG